MKQVNITITIASCEDPELFLKSEWEECDVEKIMKDQRLSLIRPLVQTLLDAEGKNDQSTDSIA